MKKLITILAISFQACAFGMDGLMLHGFWIKQMPPKSKVTAAFGEIHNHSLKSKVLLEVTGDFDESIELHTHVKEDGVMKMRKMESFEIPSHGKLILKPGGDHIMIFGLKKTLKESEPVEAIFKFKDGSSKKVLLKVSKMASDEKEHKHHQH